VKGTGKSGMVIWAATAVTAAIKATRVMVDAFNASLSMKEAVANRRLVLASFYHCSSPISGSKVASRRLIPAPPGK
jgi:hypothetical protein